jgi:hypothetical protein
MIHGKEMKTKYVEGNLANEETKHPGAKGRKALDQVGDHQLLTGNSAL